MLVKAVSWLYNHHHDRKAGYGEAEEALMYPMVEQELSRQAELEARRAGARARRLLALETYAGAKAVPDVDVAIREAESRDVPELMRLAELDSRPLPVGEMLVAEAGGKIRAALSVESSAAIADPFVPTAELLSLLELRAQQMRRDRRSRPGGVLGALHLRPNRVACWPAAAATRAPT
jgi:hypothetical protein